MGISLSEWTKDSRDLDVDSKSALFYRIDNTMKDLHKNGIYITNFDPNSIIIGDDKIVFKNLNYYNTANRSSNIVNNIYSLAALTVGAYIGYIGPIHSEKYRTYLKDNFNDYSYLFKKEDIPYYEDVLKEGHYSYYSDYVNKLDNNQVLSGNSNSRQKSYSTQAGRAFTNSDDVGNAAFMNILLIPAMISFVTIIMIVTFSLLNLFV